MAKQWYVVQGFAGFEVKIGQQIKEQAAQKGMAEQIEAVLVPTHPVVENRRGQRVVTNQNYFPGYVLVKTEMNDDVWHLIRETPKVSGILGSRTRPTPISEKEVEQIMGLCNAEVQAPRPSVLFEVGEQVRVADGPFTSFNGTIEDVDEEKGRIKVSVSIFGRATPVDLEYNQVEKV